MTTKAPKTRDYFAEMYVAGILADSGWNIYFPKRDKGFDFIITKSTANELVIRPVQVKGKYPEKDKPGKGNQDRKKHEFRRTWPITVA